MAVTFAPRWSTVTLDDGSALTTELANDAVITDQVLTATLPEMRVGDKSVPIDGGRAMYPLPGPVEFDDFSMVMSGSYVALEGTVGTRMDVDIVRELVTYPANTAVSMTYEVGFMVAGVTPAGVDTQNPGAPEASTIRGKVRSYKATKSDQTSTPEWDINLESNTYKTGGRDIWTRAT